MLVCGCINPPPKGAGYNGVYFSDADNMADKAKALGGTPLWYSTLRPCSLVMCADVQCAGWSTTSEPA